MSHLWRTQSRAWGLNTSPSAASEGGEKTFFYYISLIPKIKSSSSFFFILKMPAVTVAHLCFMWTRSLAITPLDTLPPILRGNETACQTLSMWWGAITEIWSELRLPPVLRSRNFMLLPLRFRRGDDGHGVSNDNKPLRRSVSRANRRWSLLYVVV